MCATNQTAALGFDAVFFDPDGVVTRTARLHAAAWKALFDEFLRRRAEAGGEPFQPFDPEGDYLTYVDGRPRHEGVRSFLAARGVTVPEGAPTDGPDTVTVYGLGERKNALFTDRDGAASRLQRRLRRSLHGVAARRVRPRLREWIDENGAQVWLVNAGWTGGPHGVGQRVPIPYTRAMLRAALSGGLTDVPMRTDPRFGLTVPSACPGVPADVLDPRANWRDPSAYDHQARRLASMFVENFGTFADQVSSAVRDAGPRAEA
jgi:hypothetical protein